MKKVSKILVSGDNSTVSYNEVNPVRNYLLGKGIPDRDIFLDHAGFDTYSTMYRARDVFQVSSMIISTQSFHLPRSIFIARSLGINAYGISADEGHILFKNYVREVFATEKAVLNVVFHRKPKFLGEVIPITGSGGNYPSPTSPTSPDTTTSGSAGCFIGGCSSQICSEEEGMLSTCEYREEYACYKTAKCERQESGKCGWTETPALSACLNPATRNEVGYVAGHIDIGPFCPVEREDEPCEVPKEAYSSREVIIYESNGVTVKEKGKIDADGNYKVTLAPGNYFIQVNPAGIGPGEKKPVTIKSFETTVVNFDIDTGIR